ncbi:MAG TPA: SDR family NAD(P)-dependent oxidoreductase, partial [Gammaproteobacteria bacterium]|nr:SDR family NAD(P)-dependent oxidoreductase [Gammaproteobacteria bacterium]
MDYANKVVAITGAARGIGLAMAQAFHARGARIALADLAEAEAAAETFDGLGMTVDVAVDSQVAEFIQKTETVLGPIDVYVSNAGVLMTDEPSWDAAGATDANWQLAF